jgi:CO/xanthine dehydrogenase FAD-binding subunit
MAIRAVDAEKELTGNEVTPQVLARVAEAVRVAAEPQTDMRGSAEYKRTLVAALAKRAIQAAERRARGEQVEVHHTYA